MRNDGRRVDCLRICSPNSSVCGRIGSASFTLGYSSLIRLQNKPLWPFVNPARGLNCTLRAVSITGGSRYDGSSSATVSAYSSCSGTIGMVVVFMKTEKSTRRWWSQILTRHGVVWVRFQPSLRAESSTTMSADASNCRARLSMRTRSCESRAMRSMSVLTIS